ncbi:ferrisiderophore receptor [Pectobacterium araliae]|uniref:TonB-dependent siderophore receptor n=1 Tax=Pectobacterium araliae TaxID=3073862 RepID=A0AAN0MJX3_9GAMM|nr:TonB-dependent siderophore receptor [Pectobacterium sp. MAFF 302110]GKW20072.1 ferrisiderophore receptor [Pectobacterium carotovorum subsp. carotovorum]
MKKRYDTRNTSGAGLKKRLFFTSMLNINTVLLLGATATPMLTYAVGVNDTTSFAIPAGDLQKGLLAIAEQSKQTISFNPALVVDYQSAALVGNYSTRQAVLSLLQGTPLVLITTDNGTLTIVSSRSQDVDTAKSDNKTLPGITVSAAGEEGFLSSNTATTRSGAPLQLTPQSVAVVNSEVMRKQSAQTVSDVLRNVSGVTVMPSSLGSSSVNIRGYQASVLVEGFNASSSSTPLDFPAIALESVEVLKGPGAILVGSSSPGGVVNIVRKKPQAEARNEINIGYGSYNEHQLGLDSTGALNDDGRLSYRVITSGSKSDRNAAHYDGKKDFYFAPSLRWKDDTTDFTLSFSRNVRTTPFNPYTVMYHGKPWTGNLPEPLGRKDDKLTLRQNVFSYSLEQVLSDHWTFFSKATYDDSQSYQYGWYNGLELAEDMTVWLNTFSQGGESRALDTENYLKAKYEWGDLASTSIVGVSASRTNSVTYQALSFGDWYNVPIQQPLPDLPSAKAPYRKYYGESRPLGAFLQQNVDYNDWHLTSGLRYSSEWHGVFNHSEASDSEREEVWSPSVGLLYEITPWVAIYGNYIKGYQPPSYRKNNGDLLPSQISKQNEVGLKFDLLDSRLSITTAAYRIRFNNYQYFSYTSEDYVSGPGYSSEGFEVDVQGNVLPGLDIIGHYNYGKTDFSVDSDAHEALPRHHASLWANYQFQSPQLSGFSAGVGLTYSSAANMDRQKAYTIPAQLQTDASLAYIYGKYGLNFTVKNLFNQDLYVSSLGGEPQFVPLQQPRSFLLTASYQF